MWHAIRNPEVTETAGRDIPKANGSYLPWTLSFVWFPCYRRPGVVTQQIQQHVLHGIVHFGDSLHPLDIFLKGISLPTKDTKG